MRLSGNRTIPIRFDSISVSGQRGRPLLQRIQGPVQPRGLGPGLNLSKAEVIWHLHDGSDFRRDKTFLASARCAWTSENTTLYPRPSPEDEKSIISKIPKNIMPCGNLKNLGAAHRTLTLTPVTAPTSSPWCPCSQRRK